jgi:tripartite-type tricarboxylate transporter receptor subunit TctC
MERPLSGVCARSASGVGAFLVAVALFGTAHASSHDYFKGKTMRIIVGLAPGGGFDTYSRLIARHMTKHIPGNPTIIVENMPGAGSLIAANHVYKVAKPDGLTIGNFNGGLFLQQVLGSPGIEFDARRFEHVGVPAQDSSTCAVTKASGITSLERWFASKTPVKLGATGPGAITYDTPRILQVALGLPIHLVAGYKGTADIRLAAENGEIAGGCWSWESIKATWAKGLERGEVVIPVQVVPKPLPDLPKVPLAIDFAKTEEARQLIQHGIHDVNAINRIYVMPPGTPKAVVQTVRKAFADTMKDPVFQAEAEKSRLELNPLTGEEIERIVAGLFKLQPAFVARLKEIFR